MSHTKSLCDFYGCSVLIVLAGHGAGPNRIGGTVFQHQNGPKPHCIRLPHFVYDTCNAIKVFSDGIQLDSGFFCAF